MAEQNVPATDETTEVDETATDETTEEVDWEAKYKEAVAQSRKWEERSKQNKAKADKWDAYEQEGLSEAEKAQKRAEKAEAELAQLKAEAQRAADAKEVAEKSGAPESLLLFCADREAMEAFAKEYGQEQHIPAAPPAPSSRVIRGGNQKKSNADKFADAFGDML